MNSLFATCPKGLEAVLAEELGGAHIGAAGVEPAIGGVAFTPASGGTLETAYRACLWSRVASRVLMPIARFDAPDEEALYRGVLAIAWEEHLSPDGTLRVDFTSTRSRITHTHFGALKTKDAVVDRLREKYGRRPSVDTHAPDVRINVHLAADVAQVAIDLSGDSLHRRHYRRGGGAAPLKENLAAGILMLARWPEAARAGRPLCDPMCGSGTLIIEAALMATERAPGLGRERFGFHGWLGHDEALWQRLLMEAKSHRVQPSSILLGSDLDENAIRLARAQATIAGVEKHTGFETRALDTLAPVGDRPGLLITNPPYDERLAADPALYQTLGDLLRRNMLGWEAFVLVGNPELAAAIGLKPRRRHPLFNGALECRLLEIPIAAEPVKVEAPGWRRAKEAPTAGAESFANRLKKTARHWSKWAEREGITCYRVYDADLPEYAVAIDVYEDAVHVQEYAPPKTVDADMAEARIHDVMRVVPEVLATERVFLKVRRRQKRGAQYQKLSSESAEVEAREGGHRFVVNLSDYVDTGLYLDHRRLRARIGAEARGKSFLNLFAYTGTATVYADKGGARSTVSVDLSNTYLDWASRNFALNGVNGELVRADVLEWLPAERRRFGLIFLAPPTFSNSKGMDDTLEVQRDHAQLIIQAARLLEPGGVLYFSNHFRRFKMGELPGLTVENITADTLPKDFARNPRVHNAWRITSSTPPRSRTPPRP
jgi:23S rRNA (guanine2445-N2)-methyltransferase / 23S rRNA (guanine2069-N7)-methyltransferase